jgi:hypothetical protein
MPIEFAYQVVKDLISLAKMEEADPVDPGTSDVQKLAVMGIVDDGNGNSYSWVRLRKLFSLTEARDASHEIVWVTDKLRRSKRRVVRFNSSGTIGLILVRRKAT